ncbi:unnamed protein product [Rotaria sordida]|uniref:Uncharacterized protein n=1 Tax=Rotaria sordida TaxID=392033 RepID=A0A815SYK6_9BILA|nr:unnamed protein product [Rotaria sordida]
MAELLICPLCKSIIADSIDGIAIYDCGHIIHGACFYDLHHPKSSLKYLVTEGMLECLVTESSLECLLTEGMFECLVSERFFLAENLLKYGNENT